MSYDPEFQQRIYEMLMESQYWSPEQMHAFQEQQLAQLLKFSRDTVPFYKERLAHILTADGQVNWDRWHEIPILKRDDLHNHREDMLAPKLPPGHGFMGDHMGSGTTGRPVTSTHNSLMPLVSSAALYRAWAWFDVDYRKNFCINDGNEPDVASWPEGATRGSCAPAWDVANADVKSFQINRFTLPEQVAEFVNRMAIDYLAGVFPNRMQSVALAAEKLGLQRKLAGIFTLGSAPDETMREDCRRVYDAEIISLYASKEVYNIGHQCPTGQHYHVNSELVLLEVLDDFGNPSPVGECGRAVITSFFNTAQPFIRYEIGDQLVMGANCNCGRTLPVIEKIAGRTLHMFRLPGNRKVAFSLPSKMMKIVAAQNWQFAQIKPLHIEVRIIPDGSFVQPNYDELNAIIRHSTDPDMQVSYRAMETLPVSPSGKFIQFVCELPLETT